MKDISSGNKIKLQAARVLIQEKRYEEAKIMLKGINHPTAREWLDRLEAMPSPKRERRSWGIACGVIGILLVAIASIAVLLVVRENANYTATQVVNQTTTAANATLEYLYQQQEIEVYANLATYCTSVAQRSQGDCRRWADEVISTKLAEASTCTNEYDWIRDTDNFSLCLLTFGIAVMGEQTFITPLDPNAMTSDDTAMTGALIAYCDDEQASDYCHVWAVMTFLNEYDAVATCDVHRRNGSVLTFFSCLETSGVRP